MTPASDQAVSLARMSPYTSPTRPPVVYRGHAGQVRDVTFHPEGDRLYSVGLDDTVKVWDATTPPGGQVGMGSGNINNIRARFLPGGRQIVTAGLGHGPGSLEEDAVAAAQRYGMRLIGPNCLGIMMPGVSLKSITS